MSLRHDLEVGPLGAARALLGRRLETSVGGNTTAVVLTEVEAYGGSDDPASHAFRGPTPRNNVMFGPAGHLYVYRSYGIHWCMNVVCGASGQAAAVLLRGAQPLIGTETMVQRRGRADHLIDGPGRLCQALGVTGDHNGESVFDGTVRISDEQWTRGRIETSPRIGITKGTDRPWRFVLSTDY